MKKNRKQTHKKYVCIFKYGIAVIILILAFTQLGMAYRNDSQYEYIPVRIQNGDTVWQIAAQTIDAQTDIRDEVNEIIAVNNLKHSDDIYPGQILQIPVKHTQAAVARETLHVQQNM